MGRYLTTAIIGGLLLTAITASSAMATPRTGLAPGQTLTAAPSTSGWTPFDAAVWTKHAGDDHGQNYGLVTTSAGNGVDPGTYGGAQLSGLTFPISPSAIMALSYDFLAGQTGSSGGSPRMVVCFNDDPSVCNSNGDLGPVQWTTTSQWTHVDGIHPTNSSSVWVNDGGICGNGVPEPSWTAIVNCHPGAEITAIFVVNDSGWEYPGSSETVTLDNLDVNGVIATGP